MKAFIFPILITVFVQASLAQSGNYWTQKTSLPAAVREVAVGFSINGKGYVGTGNKDGGNLLWDFWQYDPVLDSWAQKADFPPAMDSIGRQMSSGFSIGDKGYICAGAGMDTVTNNAIMYSDLWEYDSGANSWSQKASLPGVERGYHVSFSINGKGYVGTGNMGDFSSTLLDDFWEYDPTTDQWTQRTDFPGGLRETAVGFSILGKGYIGTGFDWTNGLHNDFWEYDPISNGWTQKASLSITQVRALAAGFGIDALGKGFIGVGSGPSSPTFYEYTVATNSWTGKTWYPGAGRMGVTGFSIGNRGYFACGRGVNGNSNDLWQYTPDSLTSVEELNELEVSLYPNPSNGQFSIFLIEKDFRINIFDSSGKLVFTESNKKTLDVTSLPKGIYFLKVTADEKSFNHKIVVQ